jgi:t-SNARE complex subunit (syntaxin)
MSEKDLQICRNCCVIRGNILELNKFLDKSLVQSIEHNENEQKCISSYLNSIRQLSDRIVDGINQIETSVTLSEKSDSAFHKLWKSELNFFTKEWHQFIGPKVNQIAKEEAILITKSRNNSTKSGYDWSDGTDTNDLNALKELQNSMIGNDKLIKQIEEHIKESRNKIQNIEDYTRNTLSTVRAGRRRTAEAKASQDSTNRFNRYLTICAFSVLVIIALIIILIIIL